MRNWFLNIFFLFLHHSKQSARRRRWHPTAVLLPGKSHGWRSLVGCSPWGRKESDTIQRLPFHFSLSCIGEGNGSPLQCSCLENPRERGAWWASVYGVTQSRTLLKWLSSSSSSMIIAYYNSKSKFEIKHWAKYCWDSTGFDGTLAHCPFPFLSFSRFMKSLNYSNSDTYDKDQIYKHFHTK